MHRLFPSAKFLMRFVCMAAFAMACRAESEGNTIRFSFGKEQDLAAFGLPRPGITRVDLDSGPALHFERTGGSSVIASLPVPIGKIRGFKVKVTARVRAEGLGVPPKPWNGLKLMLHFVTPDGDKWPQATVDTGPFDWRDLHFTADVPATATHADLVIGLEEVTGKAWFQDVTITSVAPIHVLPSAPIDGGPPYRGHDLPRLRGAMIRTDIKPADLRVFAAWGGNLVRWQLYWYAVPERPEETATPAQYAAWLDKCLQYIDSQLPLCSELGIKVLVDLHTLPGGHRSPMQHRMFAEPVFQAAFLDAWEKIARRYHGNKTVWGYDLVNEPLEGDVPEGLGLRNWHDLATEAARRIRAIDPGHAIIVEGAPSGGPEALAAFEPLPYDNIVYSFHMYEPFEFTHQGVYAKVPPISYPGLIAGNQWDKERMRRYLQPVVNWQRAYNKQIYVGEFSAIGWAPGDSAAAYLRDCIDLFEEYGWDWSYHAFREWQGWDVELTGTQGHMEPSPTPNARELLLRQWFGKNLRARP